MKRSLSLLSSTLLAITTFTAASATSTAMATQQVTVLPTQTTENIKFPHPDKSYLKDIPRYNADSLIHIDTGINDDTVRQLVGNPHFSEFMSNNWNYILSIRLPYSKSYIQCQLQLHFDQKDIVKNYYWNNPQCAAAIDAALQPPVPEVIEKPIPSAPDIIEKPIPLVPPEVRIFTLSSDLLFDFDSSVLKSSSTVNIDKMTDKIHQEYRKIHAVNVIGHTDYLGENAYNQRLSLQRANIVRQELIRRGFDATLLTVSGVGESAPLTNNCRNMRLKEIKLCLAPDRRVEVQVTGELK